MRMPALLGIAGAAVVLAASLHAVPASAEEADPAHDEGAAGASPDSGNARTRGAKAAWGQQAVGEAYRSGYAARAREDAPTYAALRDAVKRQAAPDQPYHAPPLPPAMPEGAYVPRSSAPPSYAAQRAAPDRARYAAPARPPQYAPPPPVQYAPPPPPPQYAQAPYAQAPYPAVSGYAQAPGYDGGPPAYQQPVYVQEAYEAPPPVQYVPVSAGDEDMLAYPVQTVAQPGLAVVVPVPHPPERRGDEDVSFPRPYRDGPMIYSVSQ